MAEVKPLLGHVSDSQVSALHVSNKSYTSSQCAFTAAMITSLVLGIVGGFALHGIFHPSALFGGFGEQMGELGAALLTGTSGLIFIMTIALAFCTRKRGSSITEPLLQSRDSKAEKPKVVASVDLPQDVKNPDVIHSFHPSLASNSPSSRSSSHQSLGHSERVPHHFNAEIREKASGHVDFSDLTD